MNGILNVLRTSVCQGTQGALGATCINNNKLYGEGF